MVGALSSLSGQISLGLVKDVENGACYLKRYGKHIDICAGKGTGLRCIRIPSFKHQEQVIEAGIDLKPYNILMLPCLHRCW